MSKFTKKLWLFLTSEKLMFFCAFALFLLLLARNPLSERTLIPNLEPYPDSFHYLVPATSFASGGSFGITRGFGIIKPSVPPLYSIALIPLFIINNDVRMFYFTNVILTLSSLLLFYLILKRITCNKWIVALTLLLFSTNYYVYWYPQWAMAENLLLPLFLGGVYILLSKATPRMILAATFIPVAMYLTKYAAAPLSLFYIPIYLVKLINDKNKAMKIIYFAFFLLMFSIPTLIILALNGVNHFGELLELVTGVFPGVFKSQESISEGVNNWTSTYFLVNNFPRYLKATLGASERFLWDFSPILPRYLALAGYLGLLLGVYRKKTRFVSASLIVLLFMQMVFVATFYSIDMRYLYSTIPTLILGVALLFVNIEKTLDKRRVYNLLTPAILIILTVYSSTNALRLKNQIMLNLRHAEVPWYYKSVLVLNNYFGTDTTDHDMNPVVVSSVPPYLIDYYSNGNYDILPLSPSQEFRTERELVWGQGDYSNLHNLYKDYLAQGRALYLSTYGLGNDEGLHAAFKDIMTNFLLIEVYSGCYTQCKIYSLH
jgi:hypothetical protein